MLTAVVSRVARAEAFWERRLTQVDPAVRAQGSTSIFNAGTGVGLSPFWVPMAVWMTVLSPSRAARIEFAVSYLEDRQAQGWPGLGITGASGEEPALA